MPYSASSPPKKTHTLSSKGRRQWVHVFNSALKSGASEQSAHQQAWAAVRNSKNRKDQKMKKKAGPGRRSESDNDTLMKSFFRTGSDPTIIPPGMVSSQIPFSSPRFRRALAASEAGKYTTRSGNADKYAIHPKQIVDVLLGRLKSLFSNNGGSYPLTPLPPDTGYGDYHGAVPKTYQPPFQEMSNIRRALGQKAPSQNPFLQAPRKLPAYHTVIENIRRRAFGQKELPQKPFLQGGLYRPDPSETMNNIRRALGQKAPPQKPLLWGGPGYKQPRLGSYLPGMGKTPPSGVMPMSSQAKPATKSLNKKSSVLLKRAAAYGSVTKYLGHRKSALYDELASYVRVCRTAQRILKAAKGVYNAY